MKKIKTTSQQRREYYVQQLLLKQVGILTPEEKEELNKKLDEMDNMTKEEQVFATLTLRSWLDQKWNLYNAPICVKCARQSFCKRQQTVKKCKFYEEATLEGEDNES